MKRLPIALAIALAAAGCGGSDEPAADVAATDSVAADAPSESASSSSPATTVAPTTTEAAAADEPGETTTTTESTTRVVEHNFGTTEIPTRPERIAVLNAGTLLPILLFLGVDTVVAAPIPEGPITATRLLSDADLADVESVGFPEVNPELLAAQAPDLILTLGFIDADPDGTFEIYSQIAPTVVIEYDLNDWRATGERVAAVLGLEAEMAAGLAEYDASVAALQQAIGDPSSVDVTVVRALGPNIRLHTPFHHAGQVFADIGFAWPESVPVDDPDTRLVQVSLEELALADADHMFVFGAGQDPDGSDVDATVQAILDHPLFPTLSVAETGNVHVVDPLGWQQGGLPGALLILDDLQEVFG